MARHRILQNLIPLLAGVIVTTVAIVPAGPAAAAASCTTMVDPVHQRLNPTAGTSLLTVSAAEAAAAAGAGMTQDLGTPFSAAATQSAGLVPIHRLHKARTGDYVLIKDGPEVISAGAHGYVDQGVGFYAAETGGDGCVPVYRYLKGSKHRFTTESGRAALEAAGWTSEGIRFYGSAAAAVASTGSDTSFTIAVIPDTQQEVVVAGDERFAERTQWLADNREDLDLQFVLHTGDVVNWGWLAPTQYAVASSAMARLEDAGVPYAIAIGNHDTRAVGWNGVAGSDGFGGSAYASNPECAARLSVAECRTSLLIRRTDEFNEVFGTDRYTQVRGAFEPGKADNIYSTFHPDGQKWLVLSLEFTPRTEVVNWARQVVETHSDYNVIVQTHYYLDGDGSITPSNAGYGANSGTYLYENLISVYPNIKLVFSGHTGDGAYREDLGRNGNRIASFLLNGPPDGTNPVRLVEIDTQNGRVATSVYSPNTGTSRLQTVTTGMTFNGRERTVVTLPTR